MTEANRIERKLTEEFGMTVSDLTELE